jgi:3D (Asp-Asp-Asp) domain-containing protein
MYRKKAGISSLSVLLIALMSTGEKVDATLETHFVRATKYHRSDPKCDPWTRRGQTSTQLRLPKDDRIVIDPTKIGNVAVDPRYVPEGSLVYETQTKRFFVATTGGTAVIDRRSARAIARKQNLPNQYSRALVFDFYSPQEVVGEHFTKCIVVEHEGQRFRTLDRESQQRRLDPEFWVKHLETLGTQIDKESKQKFNIMLERLREINGLSLD